MHYEVLLENLKQQRKNASIVSLHANWIDGNEVKMQRLKKVGLWLAEQPVAPADRQNTQQNNLLYSCKKYEFYPKRIVQEG
jgi:hypothetical protein